MNPNRRWVAVGFFLGGLLLWIMMDKFLATIMVWTGLGEYNLHLPNERFTLTTLVGLLGSGFITLYGYFNPTLSTLSNEVIVEMKKVTWPNAHETRSATVVVIVTVFIMAFLLGVFDFFWSKFMDLLYPSIQSS